MNVPLNNTSMHIPTATADQALQTANYLSIGGPRVLPGISKQLL